MCADIVDRLHDVERRAELLERALRVIRDKTYGAYTWDDDVELRVDQGGPCSQPRLTDFVDEVLHSVA